MLHVIDGVVERVARAQAKATRRLWEHQARVYANRALGVVRSRSPRIAQRGL